MARREIKPESSAPEFHPKTVPSQELFSLADMSRIFSRPFTSIHYWLLSGRIREAKRTAERGQWRVPRHEVIRLAAEEQIEIPGLWTRPSRVLVVDEEEKTRSLIQEKFRGWRISSFETAVAATINEGRARAKELSPAVIVLDCFLPKGKRVDGRRALAFIRWATKTLRAKVIGISAWEDMRGKMLEAGAVAFVKKPFHLREGLLAEIFAQLGDRRRGRRDRRRHDDVEIAEAAKA